MYAPCLLMLRGCGGRLRRKVRRNQEIMVGMVDFFESRRCDNVPVGGGVKVVYWMVLRFLKFFRDFDVF